VRLPRGRARDLTVLAGGAFLLRLAWVLVYGRVNPPAASINDTTFYQFTAASLAHGGGYTGLTFEPTAGWPPGFPFAVSLLYRVFGDRLSLALALNVVLATATVVLLYLIADRMLGRRVAVVTAGFFAILPGPLYMTGLYLSETSFIFLLVGFLALVVLLPDRRWTPLVLGVAVGLAALTRGEGLLMPIIPLAAWWGHHSRRAWLERTALLLVAMVLTIAPWTIRNAIVMDGFIPVGNNPSGTLWSGHNPEANGWIVNPTEAPAEFGSGGGASETRRASKLRHEAIEWAIHNPIKELGLIPRRLIILNQGSGGSIGGWLNAGPRYQWQLGTSSILVFTVLGDAFGYFLLFVTLASLVLLGPRRLWRMHPGMQGVLAYLALCLVNYGVVYYGQWRYRIPMEPFMIIVAAPLLVRLADQRAALADAFARLGPEARLAGD
jgi:4-amino-4-deoxy-L-arabinose transferase-like glycosyltransferase